MEERYTIGRFAAAAGVHVETVRYYQRRKLIAQPARRFGAVRRYTEVDVEQVRFIKRAQAMGFTLIEVASLLGLRNRRSCRATRELTAMKLQSIDERLRELRELRKELANWVADCDRNVEDSPCPVIERLTSPARRRAVSSRGV